MEREIMLKIHHEIRTPLNAVLGFMQIIIDDEKLTKDEYERYVKLITTNTKTLMDNIDQNLIFYK